MTTTTRTPCPDCARAARERQLTALVHETPHGRWIAKVVRRRVALAVEAAPRG